MKKSLTFICTLLLLLHFCYSALASPIPIEVAKGVSISLERSLDSSELSEPTTVTGSIGLNDHLLLKCAYITEAERNIIGGRYGFNEKMAISFEHEWNGENSSNKYGFAYKFNFKDWLDLVGLVEYKSKDIALTGQAVYQFSDIITAYGGAEYVKPNQGEAGVNLLVGVELQPIEIFSFYVEYQIPEVGDEMVYFGLTYTF